MKRILCLIVLMLAAVAPAYAQREADTTRMIRLSGGAYAGMNNASFLQDLAGSSTVAGRVSEEVFGRPWGDMHGEVQVLMSHEDPTGAYFTVSLALPQDPAVDQEKANAFLDGVMNRLLEILVNNHQQLVDQATGQLQRAELQLMEETRQLKALQARWSELGKKNEMGVMSYEQAIKAQQHAADRLRDIETDMLVMSETRDALARRIAEIAEQARERAGSDEIINQLQELLELKQQSLDRITKLVESGAASDDELRTTRAELIQTRIEIAKRREALSDNGVGERLAKLNARLDDLLVESARQEAMYSVAQKQLRNLRDNDLVGLAGEYESLQDQLRAVREKQAGLERQRARQESKLNEIAEPQIVVIE
ncbi:MAG: hypothetical protein R3C45_09695 [Phycisphaerales bacterium]